MKKSFFFSLYLFISLTLYSQVFSYETVTESGEIIPSRWTIEDTRSGFILYLENEEGSQRMECQKDGNVLSMEEWDLSSDKIFEFSTKGNLINVSIKNNRGNWKSANLSREPDIPVYQPMGLSMQSFILSDKTEQEFYVIDRNALKLRKMVVEKKGFDNLPLMDEMRDVVKTEIRLTGLLNKLWKGSCYFFPDGRWVYFEGKVDLGSPSVKIILVGIENRENR